MNEVYILEILYPFEPSKKIAGIFSTCGKAEKFKYELYESECARQGIDSDAVWPQTPFHSWITKYKVDP
jgi:hypothetical protein